MSLVNIRTTTAFINNPDVGKMDSFIGGVKKIEEEIKIRTKRVSLKIEDFSDKSINKISKDVENLGYWGFSVSFNDPTDEEQIKNAKKILSNTKNGFVNFKITKKGRELDSNLILPSTDLIIDTSKVENGFNNFRLGFSFGLENETPFFPYSAVGDKEGFSVGLEYIEAMLEIISQNNRESLNNIRNKLITQLGNNFANIAKMCESIEEESGLEFLGIDLSIAPYPYPLEDQSVIDLIEALGNIGRSRGDTEFHAGMNGTIFLHTYITSIIKEIIKVSDFKVTGFNGVMYSVLEDSKLSKRYANGDIRVSDLLLTSTTCGCGIDMVPITGWGIHKSVSSLFFDIYALSNALNKPLALRILPIPNSRPGDLTEFRHLFFANTRLSEDRSGISINELPAQKKDPVINM